MKYLLLILSLPTENAAVRMRIWRALKASGAAVLRDGVYLMPETELCRMTLDAQAKDVCDAGGMALVLNTEEPEGSCFANLFDRGEDFAVLLVEISRAQGALTGGMSRKHSGWFANCENRLPVLLTSTSFRERRSARRTMHYRNWRWPARGYCHLMNLIW
jgi:hypothetical protein